MGVRIRIQRKPPKHHASGGLALSNITFDTSLSNITFDAESLYMFHYLLVKAYVKGICPSTLWLSWVGRVDAYSFAYGFMVCLMLAKLNL